MNILVTGSTGLIGFEAAIYFLNRKHHVVGIDNDMRSKFFGMLGSTKKQLGILNRYHHYHHHNFDIRDKTKIDALFKKYHFDVVIHCAAQPSHDKAKEIPMLDFEVNTVGTLNLLESTRIYAPQAVFIFTSTNKVYGDTPNTIKLKETADRYIFADPKFKGFSETTDIDQSTHSLMGCSKLAADIYVQEYGRNYKLKTTCLRLGCVTGQSHAGTQQHGFLSFLIKSLMIHNSYQIIGYKGKQVRDQIHVSDVITAMHEIIKSPNYGEVFNLGGGTENNASILELIKLVSAKLQSKPKISFVNTPRVGDHICYITDLTRFKKRYPKWHLSKNIDTIIDLLITKSDFTPVLDVHISAINYHSALATIESWINSNKHHYISVAAVHLVMECQKDQQLLEGVNRSGLITPDGMPLVWLSKLHGKKNVQRVYGPQLSLELCQLAAKKQFKVFLLGGAVGQSEVLAKVLQKRFPTLQIVGHQDTPIRPIPQKANIHIIKQINASKAQIVFVGLGCPYQEKWMIDNQSKLDTNVIIGVGAAFDFITGKVKQAPHWMQNSGLEWLFRLSQDPKRLFYRYTVINSKFIAQITPHIINLLVQKSRIHKHKSAI